MAKSKPKSKAKPPKGYKSDQPKKITVNFKVFEKEARSFKHKAREFTNGNVTQMVRLAIHAWKPAKKSLEGIRKSTRA